MMNAPKKNSDLTSDKGFTLVELLVALVVTAIVGIALVSNSISQQRSATMVRQQAQMMQQLRGAVYLMEEDLRIAGYDPNSTGLFGVTDVRRMSVTNESTMPSPAAAPLGRPAITLAYDWDPNNNLTTANGVLDEPTVSYRLYDDNSDNILDLARDVNGQPRQLLAEGIEAIGFAFAIDADENGELDRSANGNLIWAVDTNNDNLLDTNLDTNDDGVININDAGGNFIIESADGPAGVLNPAVPLGRIRMVRIWLVARARNADPKYTNTNQYVVGDRVLPPQAGGFNDGFRREILEHTVQFRNMGQ